jgi:hypothetical protein
MKLALEYTNTGKALIHYRLSVIPEGALPLEFSHYRFQPVSLTRPMARDMFLHNIEKKFAALN